MLREIVRQKSLLGRLRRNQHGAAAIEMAIVIPFLLILTVGLVDIGRMMWYRTTLEHVAREGTRWAAVRGAGSPLETTKTAVETFVRGRTVGIADSDMDVDVDWTSNVSGQPVSVTVTMDFRFFITGLLPLGTYRLEGRSTMTFS